MTKNMAVIDSNGLVLNIILCDINEPETSNLITYYDSNPAYIGGDYVNGYFYAPQPYPSWTRDSGRWEAPVAYPEGEDNYTWDEETVSWQIIPTPETSAE
jgi:hypothetical protein